MKKTIIALMALAGVASAATYTDMAKGGDLYAGAFTLTFTLTEGYAVTGDYDILAAYYQTNGSNYNVNAFQLNSNGTLTLNRGGSLANLSNATLTNDITTGTSDSSTFTTDGTAAYTLGAGTYTLKYLGGTNGSAAADLYLGDVKVAGFTGGNHNMNGVQQGGNTLTLLTNDSYGVAADYTKYVEPTPAVPEPTTATLSLLALAGLAARRRRK